MDEKDLLERITVNPKIFGGKPIIRGRRLAVEHVLGMLAVRWRLFLKAIPGWSRKTCEPVWCTPVGLLAMSASSHLTWRLVHEGSLGWLRVGWSPERTGGSRP
jgi:hypothetical protein